MAHSSSSQNTPSQLTWLWSCVKSSSNSCTPPWWNIKIMIHWNAGSCMLCKDSVVDPGFICCSRGVARGCTPHQAVYAKNCKKCLCENSDCKFHMFACNKNKAVSKTWDKRAANLTTDPGGHRSCYTTALQSSIIFSTAGKIFYPERSRLSADNFEQFVFIKCNKWNWYQHYWLNCNV